MNPSHPPLSYRTIRGYGEETILIKKSRFIGYAQPVSSDAEAMAFVETIRKKHWDATHNCYAYCIGSQDEMQKSNDDGEPGGTAGKPILEVIKKEEVKNAVVVVTRYFGGILLGAGGLIRAYSQSAAAALHAATIVRKELHQALWVVLDYGWHGKLEHLIAGNASWIVADTQFADRVKMLVHVPSDDTEAFVKQVTNLTNGQAELQPDTPLYVCVPV
ncbi:YigZ family protein [Fodinisporobacter ferrooxydans]|uniref:YigZ family protein n=1 Tax=Fodinisporobacter ferrooxydans TaxID=2901836 RepID=A0ABY4CM34_9BACL|nr:YigZ family protein [Alicyclobacillaceae bacterium MYW30-H2]